MTHPYLPGILAEIADAAGLGAALAIAEAKGGARAHFPAHAGDDHWLTRLVGREAADKICAHLRTYAHSSRGAGAYLDVPLGPKNFYARARRAAEDMTAQGVPREEVARRLGVSMRMVQRTRARLRQSGDAGDAGDRRQGKLF